ncbi:MAG: glycosyltransferase [Saprospiraceae bacterium]|nr:glycosyltransferase [Saprospiraceae bacterium]
MGKRILFVAKNIPVPGKPSNRVILDIAHFLMDRGYDLDLLFPKEWVPFFLRHHKKFAHLTGLKNWQDGDLSIYPFTYKRIPSPTHAFRLLAGENRKLKDFAERRGGYDAIHAHYLLPDSYMALAIQANTSIPVITTVRSSDIKLLKKVSEESATWELAQNILTSVNQILVLNQPAQKFLQSRFGVPSTILPQGISENLIRTPSLEPRDVDDIVVAEAIPRKRVDWVIKAFLSAPDQQKRKMIVIGDGPALFQWKESTKQANNIDCLGRLPYTETMKWLRRSKIFALPSYQESFGLVYLEAAAAGCAIIGFQGEGPKGVLSEGKAILFPNDYASFERDLHHLLSNHSLCLQLGQQAREEVTRMPWPKIRDRDEELYHGL